MIIDHPLLGPRDASEFVYLGDALSMERPGVPATGEPPGEADIRVMHDHVHLRDNPAGLLRELWFHEQGDRSWLVVTRDTRTHRIERVELARDVALARAASPAVDGASDLAHPAVREDGSNRPEPRR